jgi:hypothetical protein
MTHLTPASMRAFLLKWGRSKDNHQVTKSPIIFDFK